MIQSYNTLVDALTQFSTNHLSLKRFKCSFFEQIDNFSTSGNSFPILYAIPSDVSFQENIDEFSFRVYCVDILQKDNSNQQTILNETLLVLRDLTNWLRLDRNNDLNIIGTPRAIPLNGFLTEFTTGWFVDITIETTPETSDCAIPFSANFIYSGVSVDCNQISPYLTCETLATCASFISLDNRVSVLEANSAHTANYYTTGATLNGTTVAFDRNDTLSAYTVDLSSLTGATDTNTFVTGFTYDNVNTFTITDNNSGSFAASIITLSATSISGGTFYGDGSNLSGITIPTGYWTASTGTNSIVPITGSNSASGTSAFVGGGTNNNSGGNYSANLGGKLNQATGDNSFVGGGTQNLAIGVGSSVIGGELNTASGTYNSSVIGGKQNTASGNYGSSVIGGSYNSASGESSFIGGGNYNSASGPSSSVVGGAQNLATAYDSFIGGGKSNSAIGVGSSVVGGKSNTASAFYSSVVGGTNNLAFGLRSAAIGGQSNFATTANSAIIGGSGNTISGVDSFIGGGQNNSVSGTSSAVIGGSNNTASVGNDVVIGGYNNTASGYGSTAIGGGGNTASGAYSIVGGSYGNIASNTESIALGGQFNTASGVESTVLGGKNNTATTRASFTLGGGYIFGIGTAGNTASGINSGVIGGNSNGVTGERSVVLGGTGITGSTNDTVYTPYLNIGSLSATTSATTYNDIVVATDGSVMTNKLFYIGVNFETTGVTWNYVAPEAFQINGIDNPSGLTYTLLHNGTGYTYGNAIALYDSVSITGATSTGFLKLNSELL